MTQRYIYSLSVSERNEVNGDPPDISSTERDDPFSPKKTLKEIESLLPDLGKENEDDIYSVLWDFAGESVYY